MTFSTPIHTNEQSIDRVLRAGLPVLLVFWRKDCAPCRQLDPALDRLAAAYAGRALVAKVDEQDNPALARRYQIAQLPGLAFVKDGRTVEQGGGAAPEEALRAWLDYLIGGGARPAPPTGPGMAIGGAARPQAGGRAPDAQATGRPGDAAGSPVILSDATFDQMIGRSAQPVLVDFWAPWCGPCRAVAPAVEQLAREFAGRAVVGKLNVDENPRTMQRFGISGIPALFIFKQGKVVERLLGAQPAGVLRQALARHV